MPDQQVPDFLGNLVSIGDRVVVVFKEEQIRVGIVADFSSRPYMGYDVPTMVVSWEKGSDRLPDKKTSAVHLHSRKFLKLFDEK
jgi:primosomal protein N'